MSVLSMALADRAGLVEGDSAGQQGQCGTAGRVRGVL